ncbi:hypothetical protein ACP70R_020152 [Stipagrostis hirtigluma subsp. patula]
MEQQSVVQPPVDDAPQSQLAETQTMPWQSANPTQLPPAPTDFTSSNPCQELSLTFQNDPVSYDIEDDIYYDNAKVIHTARSLMPVTAKMLSRAYEMNHGHQLVANRAEISTVRMLGRVTNIVIQGMQATFSIDDGTGTLHVLYWLTSANWESDEFSRLQSGNYANLVGRPTWQDGRPYIQAFSCRKITDHNEITTHFLYVIATHLELCGRPVRMQQHISSSIIRPTEQVESSAKKALTVHASSTEDLAGLNNDNSAENQPRSPRLSNCPADVIYEKPTSNYQTSQKALRLDNDVVLDRLMLLCQGAALEGVSITELVDSLSSDEATIRPIIDHLASLGEIYSTVDDEHYKPT